MTDDTKDAVLPGMVGALRVVQANNMRALQTGDGRGTSTFDMARILERESGYREMYEALEWALQEIHEHNCEYHHSTSLTDIIRVKAVLAKARGEAERTAE